MADDFGLTFVPSNAPDKTRGSAPDPNANVQEAIRTLSLHIPKVVGAKAPTSAALLNGQGSQGIGAPGGMGLEQILALLFGQARPMAGPQSPGTADLGAMSFGNPQTSGAPSVPQPHVGFINPGEPAPGTFNPGAVNGGNAAPAAPSKFIPEQRMPESQF